ncbi:membrane protein insertase YidC [Sulfuritalea sp.]|uniref:membrane protein insertase YidC n=1 Tax=Sulfuritalea sp. TaxID=2480090 RepID=UPI001AC4677F|nr:membrane protein insertase YidC [Sulfuritalea sp.]MBN8475980.1 membrane protein insertase YidC [Sulfuritalea sp.]
MDNRRLILLLVFSFSLIMLWDAWQRQNAPKPAVSAPSPTATAPAAGVVPTPTLPAAMTGVAAVPAAIAVPLGAVTAKIRTDLLVVDVSSQGGDITRVELVRHRDSEDKSKNFVLLENGGKHVYLAQSGVIGDGLPNHKMEWKLTPGERVLKDGEDKLELRLEATAATGAKVAKTYVFSRGSYQVEVRHEGVAPGAHAYYQITRDGKPAGEQSNAMMMGVVTFTGPAVYTDAEKFQKVEFADILKGKAKFAQKADNGWVAMIQHYFVSAWLPPAGTAREFFMRKVGEDLYSAGVIVPVGADGRSSVSFYVGPQEQEKLEKVAPGLDLVVDYGWLTVIAAPLFWVLAAIYKLVGNWGWAIMGLTLLLKLAFFPLSAASYKSMAKMRVLTPKLVKLKEVYGDDKQRLNQEMMALYKKEKVNPLGGCLPVLVQIPVFIALYWVLLGTVEMRNAPWLGWITDLSVKDPYYVLPLIMGATMFIQTKLNPTPPDPIQAKVMLFMPIIFTVMFLWFPAGLVLYWTVNNILSIAQQWQITRLVEAGEKK